MDQEKYSEILDKKDKIIRFISNQQIEAGLDRLIIGVSGGVDSAVTSTLCAETGSPVLALSMPIRQTKGTSRADRHLDWLEENYSNVEAREVPLEESADAIMSEVLKENDLGSGLVQANMESRLRMLTLYAFANGRNGMVVGTGNKVEDYGVGFFTKHGDGGVDIAPIADLMKTEVWDLAEYLGINGEIIDADPTDGLWEDGRTDEDQLGMSYSDLEKYMKYQDMGLDPNEITWDKKDRRQYKKYLDMNASTQHKTSMPPVCDLSEWE